MVDSNASAIPARAWQLVEGAGMALAGLVIAGFAAAGWPWWAWILGLLAPDLFMAGYLFGKRAGAFVYNLGHLYAVPLLFVMAGVGSGEMPWIAAGGLWLAHIGLDRALGFGLKQETGFRDTHLGPIGQKD